jgi:hypothetical protein
MKSVCYAAASLLAASFLLTGPASAQMQGPSEAGADSPHGAGYDAGFQDGLRAAMTRIGSMVQPGAEGSDHEMTGHMAHMHKMMGQMEDMHGMAEHHGGAGPKVVLLRGNAKIVLKCAARDSTTDCVNAAIDLLNHTAEKDETTRAKSPQLPQAAPSPAPAPTPPAGMPQGPHSH